MTGHTHFILSKWNRFYKNITAYLNTSHCRFWRDLNVACNGFIFINNKPMLSDFILCDRSGILRDMVRLFLSKLNYDCISQMSFQ